MASLVLGKVGQLSSLHSFDSLSLQSGNNPCLISILNDISCCTSNQKFVDNEFNTKDQINQNNDVVYSTSTSITTFSLESSRPICSFSPQSDHVTCISLSSLPTNNNDDKSKYVLSVACIVGSGNPLFLIKSFDPLTGIPFSFSSSRSSSLSGHFGSIMCLSWSNDHFDALNKTDSSADLYLASSGSGRDTGIRIWKMFSTLPAGKDGEDEASAIGACTHLFQHGNSGPTTISWNCTRKNAPLCPSTSSRKGKRKRKSDSTAFGEDEPPAVDLASGGEAGEIILWNLKSRGKITTLQGHSARITALRFMSPFSNSSDLNRKLVSISRDKLIVIWIEQGLDHKGATKKSMHSSWVKLIAVPLFEPLEGLTLVNDRIFVAGERGIITSFDENGTELLKQPKLPSFSSLEIHRLFSGTLNQSDSGERMIVAISHDRRFLFFNPLDLSLEKTIVGQNDEVLDVSFLGNLGSSQKEVCAVATNCNDIRLYQVDRSQLFDNEDLTEPNLEPESVTSLGCFASYECSLLSGHSDIVICLSSTTTTHNDPQKRRTLLASGSKDKSLRLWGCCCPQPCTELRSLSSHDHCLAVSDLSSSMCHTAAVGTISFSCGKLFLDVPTKLQNLGDESFSKLFLVSGSQDCTVKVWHIQRDKAPFSLQPIASIKAHEKDVNSVAVSPNDRFVASGGQDKLVKLWYLPTTAQPHREKSNPRHLRLGLAAVLKGHSRAVWSVAFSPTDKCVASCSADGTAKLWKMHTMVSDQIQNGETNLTTTGPLVNCLCVRTFSSRDTSRPMLKAVFCPFGQFLVTAGGDGQIRTWKVSTGEECQTIDAHSDRAWALSAEKTHSGEQRWFFSAGADGQVFCWADFSKQVAEREALQKELMMTTQARMEAVVRKTGAALRTGNIDQEELERSLLERLELALTLDRPRDALKTLSDSLDFVDDSEDGPVNSNLVETLLTDLLSSDRSNNVDSFSRFMLWIQQWNTNSKNSRVAQRALHSILRIYGPAQVFEKLGGHSKSVPLIEALMAYSERHFERLENLVGDSFLLDYCLVEGRRLKKPKLLD